MERDEMQKQIENLLKQMGVPGFIVFGYQQGENEGRKHFDIVWSMHEMPTNAAIKGVSNVLNDLIHRTLK